MPSIRLTPEQTDNLVAYILNLKRNPGDATDGGTK
jgi:hypothetical protein